MKMVTIHISTVLRFWYSKSKNGWRSIHHNNLKLTNRDYPRRENSRVSGEQQGFDPNIDECVDITDLLERERIISFMYCIVMFYKYTSVHNKSDSSLFLKQEHLLEKSFHKSIIRLDLVKNILNKDRNLLKYIE